MFSFDLGFNSGAGPLSGKTLAPNVNLVACDNSGRRLRNRGPSCCTRFGQTETRFYSHRHHTSHILLPPVTALQYKATMTDRIASVVLQEMITKIIFEINSFGGLWPPYSFCIKFFYLVVPM